MMLLGVITNMFKLIAFVILSLILSGCAENAHKDTKIVYVSNHLTLPVSSILPTLKSTDLGCLDDVTKQKLLDRENLRKEYIQELQAIINSTK